MACGSRLLCRTGTRCKGPGCQRFCIMFGQIRQNCGSFVLRKRDEGSYRKQLSYRYTRKECHKSEVRSVRGIAMNVNTVEERVRAEFEEMPGMTLTVLQAARLFGLQQDTCQEIVERLVASAYLRWTG